MSLIQQYAAKEQQMKALQEELEKLKGDERLQREIEFKDKLEELMKEFDKSGKDVLDLLAPNREPQAATSGTGRRKRKLKIYKNPHTGEVVETRGGNQKTLKAWKDEHGSETVESWLVRVEE